VTEGNSGTTPAVFTVNLSAPSSQAVTVSIATANGSATAPGDYYSAQSTVLTFAPGTTSQTLTVPVVGDTVDEANEDFFVNLSSAGGAIIGDGQGKGTIVDDDASPSVSISNATVLEGNSGMTLAVFTVTLSAASAQAISLSYSTASGTASSGKDYTAIGTTGLTFAAGETSKLITVQVKGDKSVEQDETFFVNLSNVAGATLLDGQGLGTIVNDDSRRNRQAARQEVTTDTAFAQLESEALELVAP
jgi:hypothetical protein